MRCLEAPVLTAGKVVVDIERRLSAERLASPGCGEGLAPWGHTRMRRMARCGFSSVEG